MYVDISSAYVIIDVRRSIETRKDSGYENLFEQFGDGAVFVQKLLPLSLIYSTICLR
jgi:hypothetical protein